MKDIYNKALQEWGIESQMVKTQEEAGELISAISRTYYNQGDRENVIEEIADMQIMLNQLKLVYGVDEVNEKIRESEQELRERIE